MAKRHCLLSLILALFWTSTFSVFASDVVVIQTPILKSYFYRQIKQPLHVDYILYRGGGDCDRAGMSFKNDQSEIQTATAKDYAGSGYDIGHLANAEDFAGDCSKERLTFVFYNAVPQTPNLNRGVWKRIETRVRGWSQSDHLLVICGGHTFRKKGRLYVPATCFKVVQSMSTGKILFCAIFTNTSNAKERDLSEAALEKELGYRLPIGKTTTSSANGVSDK